MSQTVNAAALAAAAALLFAAQPSLGADGASDGTQAQVQCFGINACKGQAACKTASNECQGLNSCKGQGFVMASKQECTAKGGRTEAA